MPVRLIATDLDGTLFGSDHLPAPRTVAAVNAVRDAGIDVVGVTGRSHFSGAPLAVSTGARLRWFIGSNGGHRLDYASGDLEDGWCSARRSLGRIPAQNDVFQHRFRRGPRDRGNPRVMVKLCRQT